MISKDNLLLGNFVEATIVAQRATKVKLLNSIEFMNSVPPESDDMTIQFDRLQKLAMVNNNYFSGAMSSGKLTLPRPPSEILGL